MGLRGRADNFRMLSHLRITTVALITHPRAYTETAHGMNRASTEHVSYSEGPHRFLTPAPTRFVESRGVGPGLHAHAAYMRGSTRVCSLGSHPCDRLGICLLCSRVDYIQTFDESQCVTSQSDDQRVSECWSMGEYGVLVPRSRRGVGEEPGTAAEPVPSCV